MTSVFGRILEGGAIERAVRDTLQTWLRTYLIEVERQGQRPAGALPQPREWRIVNELEAPLGPKQLPAVWLVSAGLDGEPDRDGAGYTAAWLVEVAVIVSARDHETTVATARLYAAAIRGALVQNPALGGLAMGVEWVDETYDRGPAVLETTTAYASLTFRVHVDAVTDPFGGPAQPLPTPLPDPIPDADDIPVVETVDVVLTPTAGDPS